MRMLKYHLEGETKKLQEAEGGRDLGGRERRTEVDVGDVGETGERSRGPGEFLPRRKTTVRVLFYCLP